MLEKVVWYLLFATLALAGVWVCLSPVKLAQLLGASDVIHKSKRLKVWRVLGLVVLVGSIVELVMMATGIRR